jgi:hypothetical protein
LSRRPPPPRPNASMWTKRRIFAARRVALLQRRRRWMERGPSPPVALGSRAPASRGGVRRGGRAPQAPELPHAPPLLRLGVRDVDTCDGESAELPAGSCPACRRRSGGGRRALARRSRRGPQGDTQEEGGRRGLARAHEHWRGPRSDAGGRSDGEPLLPCSSTTDLRELRIEVSPLPHLRPCRRQRWRCCRRGGRGGEGRRRRGAREGGVTGAGAGCRKAPSGQG